MFETNFELIEIRLIEFSKMGAHSFVSTLKEAKNDDAASVKKAKPEAFTGADCIRLLDAPVPYLALPPKPDPAVPTLSEIRVSENSQISKTIKVS